MRITINIESSHVLIILLFIAAASAISLVAAYGGTSPTTMGHSWGEIACSGCITTSNLADASVTDAKIASISGGKVTGTVPNADTVDGLHANQIVTWGSPCYAVWDPVCSTCEYYGYTRYCYYYGITVTTGGVSKCLYTPGAIQGSCGTQWCGYDTSGCSVGSPYGP